MLRLFIAVTLPEEALAACGRETRRVEEALGPLAKGVRFPRGEGLHFTLKFLGPTDEELVAPLKSALEQAAAQVAPFSLVLKGLQAFPNPRRPRVVFLATAEGAGPMKSLAAAVEEHVSPLGFPSEERAYTPHVTLARVKDFKAAQKIGTRIAELPAVEVARFEVRDVALMLSELSAGGSRYTALARLALGQRATQ
ncbi:MAG TPA: RNA 2',3'-cyclic phosphodiesterase [Myxococcales bacterium]|jgi:2'-5' RNA ligase